MRENAANGALRYIGYDNDVVTAHRLGAMVRTTLDEVLGDLRPAAV